MCSKCKRAKSITGNKDAKCLQHGLAYLCKKAGITIATPQPKPVLNTIRMGNR